MTELLHVAARSGNVEQASSLISQGVDFNAKINGNQAIHWAAIYGNNNVLDLLLSTGQVDVDCTNSYCCTALHYAVCGKHYSTIELLVSKNASSNIQDIVKRTALHWALKYFVGCRNHNYCLKTIENKCKVIPSYLNEAPVNIRCAYLAIAAFLINEAKADFMIRDIDGQTPLDFIRNDRVLVVDYLKKYANSCNHLEVSSNIDDCIKRIEDMEIDVESSQGKVKNASEHENSLIVKCNLIMKMRQQLGDYEKLLDDRNTTILNLQAMMKNMNCCLKQRENDTAVFKKELVEYENISQKDSDNLNNKNKEINTFSNQVMEKFDELVREGIRVRKLEKSLATKDVKIMKLIKQFSESAIGNKKEVSTSNASFKIALEGKDEDIKNILQEYSMFLKMKMFEEEIALRKFKKQMAVSLCKTFIIDFKNELHGLKYRLQEFGHEFKLNRTRVTKNKDFLKNNYKLISEMDKDKEIKRIKFEKNRKVDK